MNGFHFHTWQRPLCREAVRDFKYLGLTSAIILTVYTPIFQIIFFGGPDVLSNPANTIAGALLISFAPRILARISWRTYGSKDPARKR